MEYRVNRRTGDRVSVIGIGTSYICESDERDAVEALEFAYEKGINYADLATAKSNTFRSLHQKTKIRRPVVTPHSSRIRNNGNSQIPKAI